MFKLNSWTNKENYYNSKVAQNYFNNIHATSKSSACGGSCGAGDEKISSACGGSCGAGDEKISSACGGSCGAGDK